MASRKEQKERLRRERLEREQAAAAAAARRRRLGYAIAGGLVGAVAIALVAIAFASGGGGATGGDNGTWPSGAIPKQKETDLTVAAKLAGCVLQHPHTEIRTHTHKHLAYKHA